MSELGFVGLNDLRILSLSGLKPIAILGK